MPSVIRTLLRPALALLVVTFALVLPAAASARPAFTVKVVDTNHAPIANNSNWWLTLHITKNGKPISGAVLGYQIFVGGDGLSWSNVTCERGCKIPKGDRNTPKGYLFAGGAGNHYGDFSHGTWRDNLQFPAASKGQHLQLRILVRTRYGRQTVSWNITPKA